MWLFLWVEHGNHFVLGQSTIFIRICKIKSSFLLFFSDGCEKKKSERLVRTSLRRIKKGDVVLIFEGDKIKIASGPYFEARILNFPCV